MVGIYKITNPNGKVYIGQSIHIDKRFYQYRKKNKEKLHERYEKKNEIIKTRKNEIRRSR